MKISAHFSDDEFFSPDGRKSPYPNAVRVELLNELEKVRIEFGRPIYVNSGYRSPEYNSSPKMKALGAVPNSLHCQGLAADVRPKDLKDLPRLQRIALDLVTHGGVGLYDTFVHIDGRGQKARWDNRKCRKQQ